MEAPPQEGTFPSPDRGEIESVLRRVPPEVAAAFATRCALLALPHVFENPANLPSGWAWSPIGAWLNIFLQSLEVQSGHAERLEDLRNSVGALLQAGFEIEVPMTENAQNAAVLAAATQSGTEEFPDAAIEAAEFSLESALASPRDDDYKAAFVERFRQELHALTELRFEKPSDIAKFLQAPLWQGLGKFVPATATDPGWWKNLLVRAKEEGPEAMRLFKDFATRFREAFSAPDFASAVADEIERAAEKPGAAPALPKGALGEDAPRSLALLALANPARLDLVTGPTLQSVESIRQMAMSELPTLLERPEGRDFQPDPLWEAWFRVAHAGFLEALKAGPPAPKTGAPPEQMSTPPMEGLKGIPMNPRDRIM